MGQRANRSNSTRFSQNFGIQTAAGTALANNNARVMGRIQNLGTNPLFVKFGLSASTTDFTFICQANTVADNGTSLPREFYYNGDVSVAGTTPRFIASEDIL